MATVDTLPGDQRAVLQLVLGRGRSYDQIAGMLSMNPAAVRERAHAAVDALGPQTGVPTEHRRLIADYLLSQLAGPDETERARGLLAGSPAQRAWARVVSSELAPLASGTLPEIPVEGASPAAPEPPGGGGPFPPVQEAPPVPPAVAAPAPEPEPVAPAIAAAAGPRLAPSDPAASGRGGDGRSGAGEGRSGAGEGRSGAGGRGTGGPGGRGPGGDGPGGGGRSSRLGGAIVLAVALIAIAVVVVLLTSGGGNPSHRTAASQSSTTTPAASASASSSSSTTATTSASTSASAKVVAQINLTPPSHASKAAGIAEVLDEGASQGIAIVADNVPANRTAPHPNAYAVWLYNSPSDAQILGFVNPGVGSNGRLSTAGALPGNASRYKQLVVTVETKAKPAKPGPIILRGPLTGLS